MISRSPRQQARPSRDAATLLHDVGVFFACSVGVLFVALAAAPGSAVAHVAARSQGHGQARQQAVPGTPRSAVLDVGLARALARRAQAVHAPALPAGQHDTAPGGIFRTEEKAPCCHGSDAHRAPRTPVWWRNGGARTLLPTASAQFEAAPAIHFLSRAPPRG